MNDERFIELLNLYIDRELSGSEVDEIEEAIASSPKRQRIYAQYCKIQRACEGLLAQSPIVTPKPNMSAILSAARSPEEAEVLAFPSATIAQRLADESISASRRNRAGWGWGALSGMAAAALAFVAYNGAIQSAKNDASLEAAPQVATVSDSGPTLGTDDDATSAYASTDSAAYRTVLTLDSGNTGDRSGLRLATPSQSEDPFAWMAQVRFEPIRPVQVDNLEFRTGMPMEVRNLPAFSYPYPGLDDTPPLSESAAFQFQR